MDDDRVEAPRFGLITAVSGIRDLSPASEPDVWNAIADEVHGGTSELRFGGAVGVDTIALLAANAFRRAHTRLEVLVPARISDQPEEAIDAAEFAADEIHELDLEPSASHSYLRRNDELLEGANRLLAFTDGRDEGGTSYTIDRALDMGLDVVVVPVRGTKRSRMNPRIDFDAFSAPVYALDPYVPRDVGSDLTDFIWDLKGYRAKPKVLQAWAERLAEVITRTPALAKAAAIVPMPRRDPALRSDLTPLARAVARITGQDVLVDWLVRTREPKGGDVLAGREHFGPAEHAETLVVEGPEGPAGLILLDNVVTAGGTMAGAQAAVRRDTGLVAFGLALAYSADMEPFVVTP